MRRKLSQTVSTKRVARAAGKIGLPATHLSGLKCTPLYPVDPEIKQRMVLDTPHEVKECFIAGAVDILEGDVLVMASVDYPIKAVADWGGILGVFKRLIVEDLKT